MRAFARSSNITRNGRRRLKNPAKRTDRTKRSSFATQPSFALIGSTPPGRQCVTMSVLAGTRIRVLWNLTGTWKVTGTCRTRGKDTRWYLATVVSATEGPTGPTVVVQYAKPSARRYTHNLATITWKQCAPARVGAREVAPTVPVAGALKAAAQKAALPKAAARVAEVVDATASLPTGAAASQLSGKAAARKRKAPAGASLVGVASPAASAGSRRDPGSGVSEGASKGGSEGGGPDTSSLKRRACGSSAIAADAGAGAVLDGALRCTCTATAAPPAGATVAADVGPVSGRYVADNTGTPDGGAMEDALFPPDTAPASAVGLARAAPDAAGVLRACSSTSGACAAAPAAPAALAATAPAGAGTDFDDVCNDEHLGPIGGAHTVSVKYCPYSASGERVVRTGDVTCARTPEYYVAMVVVHGCPVTAHNLENGNWALAEVDVSSPDQLPSQPPEVARRRLESLVALCKLREDAVMARVLGLAALHAQAEVCAKAVAMSSDPSEGDRVDAMRALETYLTKRVEASRSAGF